MTRLFGGILPYEAEVSEPNGPRIIAFVLSDYGDRCQALFEKWLAKHDAEVQAAALRTASDRMPAFHDRDVPEWAITSACAWLETRADQIEEFNE